LVNRSEKVDLSAFAVARLRRSLLMGLGSAAVLGLNSRPAAALGVPKSAPVLTVSGKVSVTNEGNSAVFDMAMLEALPQTIISTKTPWYPEVRTFTGPLLRDVLLKVGAYGETLRLRALNDFRATMPAKDAQQHDVILARLIDGKPMSIREKGPLFVMYPFDAVDQLRSTVYYARAVWQLHSIEST
jgi:hypothetical protein